MKDRVLAGIDGWNRYWFREAPLINLSICRILIVALQLVLLWIHRARFFAAADLPRHLYEPLTLIKLLLTPFGSEYSPDEASLVVVFVATIIAGVAGLVGFHTRKSLGAFAVGNIFLQGYAYSFGEIHHPEALMMIALVLLALSPSGEVLSVDSFRRKTINSLGDFGCYMRLAIAKKSEFAAWPLLVIQVLFAIVYFDAGISKAFESGLDWMNGYTLQYYLGRDGIRWGSELGIWLSERHAIAQAASVVAYVFELSFFLVVLIPRLALIYIPVGIGMHVGIYLTMKAPFFQFLVLYSVFVPWASLVLRSLDDEGSYLGRLHSFFYRRRLARQRPMST